MGVTADTYLTEVLEVGKHFCIFPVDPSDHTPAFKGWQDWATQDVDKIRKYWTAHPNAKVGVLTGYKSGVFVVDLDVKHGRNGIEKIKELQSDNTKLPKTYGHRTKSGGMHLFYRYDETCEFRNRANALRGADRKEQTGIDIRAEGGYVVAYPSAGYKKLGSPSTVETAPPWLIKKLNDERKGGQDSNNNGRTMDHEELEGILSQLDPRDYQDRESWMRIMCMVKNASNGEHYGQDLFTQWSLRDDSGFSQDPVSYIEKMWPTIDAFRDGGLTCNSLGHEVKQARIKKDANEFGDEGQDVKQYKEKKEPKEKYKAVVTSDVDAGDSVWHTVYKKSLDAQVLTTVENNLIQLLIQPTLPRQLGRAKNPLRGLIKYNELKQCIVYSRMPPWARVEARKRHYVNKEIQEQDITELRTYCLTRYELNFTKGAAESAVIAAGHRLPFHPARDWMKSLEWDYEDRLETWLIECAGAEDTPYVRAISKKMLISIVARAMKPGCKVDTIPILEGSQGIGKSTLLEILGGEWYKAPEIKIGEKDAEQNIQGLLIAEWSEFAHGYRELEAFKRWATVGTNRFRGSYGKSAQDWPRTCVIFITMNPSGDGCYLVDSTGNRRMWPVRLRKKVDLQWVREHRELLFAEAVACYEAGDIWHLTDEEGAEAYVETEKRMIKDPWHDPIREYLYEGQGKDLDHVSSVDLAVDVLGIDHKSCDMRVSRKIATILRTMNWYPGSVRVKGIATKRFRRPVHDKGSI